MAKKNWGFDTKRIDKGTRSQDDFFRYANGAWMKRSEIPKEESRWGAFVILRRKTELELKAIVDEMLAKKNAKAGSPEQMIRDFFRSGMDLKTRARLGSQPIEAWRTRIAALSNLRELQDTIADLHCIGVDALFGGYIEQDAKDSERYLFWLGQGGLGMPDRDYYLKDDAESVRVREAYVLHLRVMFKLAGRSNKEAERGAAVVMRIETALARLSMNKVDRREIEKINNKRTFAQLQKLAPAIDWARYFKRIGSKPLKTVVVMQPKFFAGMSALLTRTSIEDWKTYLDWHLVGSYASALSPAFVRQNFSFYGTTLSGVKHMKPLWRRVLAATNGSLGEQLAKLYIARHFDQATKKRVDEMVNDLLAAYRERIKQLDWMTPATKKKALAKLSVMTWKIGYPKKWRDYRGLVVRSDDYAGNLMRAAEHEHVRQMRKLLKKVDRDEWYMYPHDINAYCMLTLNDIAFPAGILQPPFFDKDADDAVNYGSMGSVIGHEMTHNFDDEGAKFDAKGNLKKWWTKQDECRFVAKGKKLTAQFNKYQVHGVPVNGKLTLGENVADLAGATIALDAYRRRLARTGRRDIDGFTPEQRFFLAFSVFGCTLMRPEVEKLQVLTDPHSPGQFRINGPASNMPEFYEAFGVRKGDKLWREPKDRVKIW